jgi:hypothetical protein
MYPSMLTEKQRFLHLLENENEIDDCAAPVRIGDAAPSLFGLKCLGIISVHSNVLEAVWMETKLKFVRRSCRKNSVAFIFTKTLINDVTYTLSLVRRFPGDPMKTVERRELRACPRGDTESPLFHFIHFLI